MIDDYNHHIGRVDIADQLQSKFSTQQRGVKPWRALFYWLLDTTVINAFLISEHQRRSKLLLDTKDKIRSTHCIFRESLVTVLLLDLQQKPQLQTQYITKTMQLLLVRLTRPIEIHQVVVDLKKGSCLFCRWSRHRTNNKRGLSTTRIAKSRNLPKVKTICSYCRVVLCNNCFYIFHYTVD
jgi:hypothetical protein